MGSGMEGVTPPSRSPSTEPRGGCDLPCAPVSTSNSPQEVTVHLIVSAGCRVPEGPEPQPPPCRGHEGLRSPQPREWTGPSSVGFLWPVPGGLPAGPGPGCHIAKHPRASSPLPRTSPMWQARLQSHLPLPPLRGGVRCLRASVSSPATWDDAAARHLCLLLALKPGTGPRKQGTSRNALH